MNHARGQSTGGFRKIFIAGVFVVTLAYGAFLIWSPGPAEQAVERIREASVAVEGYRDDTGQLPPDLETLVAEGRLDTNRDNFGYNLVYRKFDGRYDIYSVGPDGMPASRDDIRATEEGP